MKIGSYKGTKWFVTSWTKEQWQKRWKYVAALIILSTIAVWVVA